MSESMMLNLVNIFTATNCSTFDKHPAKLFQFIRNNSKLPKSQKLHLTYISGSAHLC